MSAKHLPDPRKYRDPIRYFRDSHGVINEQLVEFERLLQEVASIGPEKAFAQSKEAWDETLHFFRRSAPRHEREEEQTLFPVLSDKFPSIGFRSANDPSKFLSAEHFEMRRLTRYLTDIWNQFKTDPPTSVEQGADFQRTGAELLSMYKQHIAKENEIIYKLANDELLSPDEREDVMRGVVSLNSPESSTAILNYDQSDYSDVTKSNLNVSQTDGIDDDELNP
jgi:hemerythrin-like domain-containing protein